MRVENDVDAIPQSRAGQNHSVSRHRKNREPSVDTGFYGLQSHVLVNQPVFGQLPVWQTSILIQGRPVLTKKATRTRNRVRVALGDVVS